MTAHLDTAQLDYISSIEQGGESENRCIRYLIGENKGKIRAFVLRNNGSEADFEDVFQHGIVELLLNIRKGLFRGDSTIHTYLFAICKGIWYKRFHKGLREIKYVGQEIKTAEEQDFLTPEKSLIDLEMKQKIDSLLSLLKVKCKNLLVLWSKKYSMTEIAKNLEYSSAQVAMNKKNRCLKELRQIMINYPHIRKEFKDWLNE